MPAVRWLPLRDLPVQPVPGRRVWPVRPGGVLRDHPRGRERHGGCVVSAARWTHASAEQAAHQAAQDAAGQVAADLAADLHSREVLASHQGSPSVSEQSHTHGAPAPPVDKGPRPRWTLADPSRSPGASGDRLRGAVKVTGRVVPSARGPESNACEGSTSCPNDRACGTLAGTSAAPRHPGVTSGRRGAVPLRRPPR